MADMTTGASPDAVELVLTDHRAVEQLFSQLDAASTPDTRLAIGERIIQELSVHAVIEEMLLYPALRGLLGDDEPVDHAIEEHDELKRVLADLDGTSPDDDGFTAGFAQARRLVDEHVAEEERDLLPRLRSQGDPERLHQLGAAMDKARKTAPTHPHPHAPSSPAGHVVLGPLVAVVDRVRDAARGSVGSR